MPPRELGKERRAEADRAAVSNAAEAQRMRALEPSGGTLTLLELASYTGNTPSLPVKCSLPAYLRATWDYSHLQVNVARSHQPVSRTPLLPASPTSHL